ncbi:MAG: ThuA domain-containing protein [Chitinophagaceae bacterium]|nr:ThuA domain-containing protein [Chitinophagaceae bacterium]MCW5928499.1 ThuA domain-containing protein [Chitinophagaceae bacterium]
MNLNSLVFRKLKLHQVTNRRSFIKATTAFAVGSVLPATLPASSNHKKIRVLVWDERQPVAKETYGDFLGNHIAGELKKDSRFEVISAALDDTDQGISTKALSSTDVLIWWGHLRHGEVSIEKSREIVQLISAGKLAFIGLHSAHWSNPFTEAMNEVTRLNVFADKTVREEDVRFVQPELRKALPLPTDRISPYTEVRKFPDGSRKLTVHLPNCCFPGVANDGKPSILKKIKWHPVLEGLPDQLSLSQTEMYGEPFHVPAPDELLMEEYWEDGNWFRSVLLWKLGKGNIFYFRPGHETYPIFKERWVLQLLVNAITWIAPK